MDNGQGQNGGLKDKLTQDGRRFRLMIGQTGLMVEHTYGRMDGETKLRTGKGIDFYADE